MRYQREYEYREYEFIGIQIEFVTHAEKSTLLKLNASYTVHYTGTLNGAQ